MIARKLDISLYIFRIPFLLVLTVLFYPVFAQRRFSSLYGLSVVFFASTFIVFTFPGSNKVIPFLSTQELFLFPEGEKDFPIVPSLTC